VLADAAWSAKVVILSIREPTEPDEEGTS